MKKGVTSLDAMLAFLLILFIVIFTQKASSMALIHSDSFGASIQAQATAEELGSLMNSFYATNPGASDKITGVNNYTDIKFFGDYTFNAEILKQSGNSNVTVTITTLDEIYSSSYPTAQGVQFDSTNGEILPWKRGNYFHLMLY